MLDWLRRLLVKPAEPPQQVNARGVRTHGLSVSHTMDDIVLHIPGAPPASITWSELETITIVSSEQLGSNELYWLISGSNRRHPLIIPMGAPGEHELVQAMQARLDGFDNMAVVEAMSSVEDALFIVWEAEK